MVIIGKISSYAYLLKSGRSDVILDFLIHLLRNLMEILEFGTEKLESKLFVDYIFIYYTQVWEYFHSYKDSICSLRIKTHFFNISGYNYSKNFRVQGDKLRLHEFYWSSPIIYFSIIEVNGYYESSEFLFNNKINDCCIVTLPAYFRSN